VRIDGDLNVRLSLSPRIEVSDLTIGNAEWSDVQPMLHVSHADVRVKLWSLLVGEPNLPQIDLRQPELMLERNANGEANWVFGEGRNGSSMHVGGIRVDNGTVRYRDPNLFIDVTSSVDSVSRADDPAGSLRFNGKGAYRGEPFAIDGTGMGLSALREVDAPYRLDVHAKAGATEVRFNGSIVPSKLQDVNGRLSLQGPDLSKLYPIVPAKLPWTPTYKLTGTLGREQAKWRFTDIAGTVGKSDLAGEFSVDLSRPRPAIAADLTSRQMHYEDLGGFVGLPPVEPGRAPSTPEQRSVAVERQAKQSALAGKPVDTGGLRSFDADVKFRGRNVSWSRFPMDNLTAHMVLKNGLITLDPLDFGIADGHVVSKVSFDVTQAPAAMQGQFEIRDVELKRLFPQLASPHGTAGRFGGYAKFNTHGNSLAQWLGSGDGEGAVIMRGGEASTLAVVLTNLDLARAATLLLRGNETSEIRCAASAFDLDKGVLTPRFMVIDTSAEKITVSGGVNFAAERYDLHFKAQSKQPSALALRGPIVIGGSFKQPSIHPEALPLIARIGAAVGLGAVAGPAALLALVDFGGASDADCRALIQGARQSVNAPVDTSGIGSAPDKAPARAASR